MFERISTGWKITKQSFKVLKADKEIVLFPIIGGLLTLAITAIFIIPFILGTIGASLINESFANVTMYIILFVYLIVVYFINLFFEGAVITSAMQRFSGKNPSFSDGLKGPSKRIPALFVWAIINAIAAILLSLLSRAGKNHGKVADIGAQVASTTAKIGWSLLTFFMLPILIFEHKSTWESMKKSKDLFIKTWGENITAQITTGGIFGIAIFIGIIPALLSLLLGIKSFIMVSIIIFFIWICIVSIISASVNGILRAALYQYAIKGKLPQVYDQEISKVLTRKN